MLEDHVWRRNSATTAKRVALTATMVGPLGRSATYEIEMPAKLANTPAMIATANATRRFFRKSSAVAAGRTRRSNTTKAPAARIAREIVTPTVRKRTTFHRRALEPECGRHVGIEGDEQELLVESPVDRGDRQSDAGQQQNLSRADRQNVAEH
jgi:hypothetical protein